MYLYNDSKLFLIAVTELFAFSLFYSSLQESDSDQDADDEVSKVYLIQYYNKEKIKIIFRL